MAIKGTDGADLITPAGISPGVTGGTPSGVNDVIYGYAGNDTIDGGGGNDDLYGGTGNDVYKFSGSFGADEVLEGLGEGTDRIELSGIPASAVRLVGDAYDDLYIIADGYGSIRLRDHLLTADVEQLKIGAGAVISLTGGLQMTGDGLNNRIYGTTFNDTIDGAAGNDVLYGGAGNDVYKFSGSFGTDEVVEALGGGTDRIELSGIPASAVRLVGDAYDDLYIIADGYGSIRLRDHLLTADVEQLKIGSGAVISLTGGLQMTGDGLNNRIYGTTFNDTIDGAAGNDVLYGGAGNDVYKFSGNFGTDEVVEAVGGGTDRIELSGIPASAVRLVGDAYDDLYIIADGYGSIRLRDHLLTADVEQLKIGSGAVISLAGGIHMTGDGLNNRIYGTSFNDTIDGGGGNDTLTGHAGNDTYYVDSSGDVVKEATGGGYDRIYSSVSHTLEDNVETLTLTGTHDLDATGNDLGNRITGNAGDNHLYGLGGNDTILGGDGNDTINGGPGADSMAGGDGNDTYYVSSGGDVASESAGGGYDRIYSSVSHTLEDNIENLTLTGTGDISGTGNDLGNRITGNAGDNHLYGLGGADTILGGAGNDTIDGGAGTDSMAGGSGNDTYYVNSGGDVASESAGAGYDRIYSSVSHTLEDNIESLTLTGTHDINGTGNALGNRITGNAGDNILTGAGGADTIIGGDGDDVFDYNALSDSSGTTVDHIIGFDGAGIAGGDRIDLRDIDARTGGTDQAFILGGAFTAGHLRLSDDASGNTVVEGNVDGDAAPEFVLIIEDGATHASDYTSGDFFL